jgi:hypothetical protein
VGARARRCSPTVVEGGGAGRGGAGGVLTGAQAATERRCDGEEDQWWLEFAVRVKEGTRELKSEGW